MKKGKKRKFADTQSSVNSEKKRNSGSGSGQTSYLHLRLEMGEGGREADLSPEYVENHLIMALKTLFGEVGAAIPFSVREVSNGTECEEKDLTAREIVVEVLDSGLDKLRAAATLQGTYQGREVCLSTVSVKSSFSPSVIENS